MDYTNIRAMMTFTDTLRNKPNKAYKCFKNLSNDFTKEDLVNIVSEFLLSMRENIDDSFHGYLYRSILGDVQIELDEMYDKLYDECSDHSNEYADFVDDTEKMRDYFEISKEEFLMSYSYLSEADYDMTTAKINNMTSEEVEQIKAKYKNLPYEDKPYYVVGEV